jgi:hypothetical protein
MSKRFWYFYICEDCKEAIQQRLDTIKNMKWVLCRNCSNKKRSRDNRDKIREATFNQMKNGNWVLGNITPEQEERRAKHFSETMKKKYASGELKTWNKGMTGELSHMWIKDRTKVKYKEQERIRKSYKNKIWRRKVFRKDGFSCQICHDKSRKNHPVILNAHHIKSFIEYPKFRFKVSNGITLCKSCHVWIHNLNPLSFQ